MEEEVVDDIAGDVEDELRRLPNVLTEILLAHVVLFFFFFFFSPRTIIPMRGRRRVFALG